MVTTGPNRVCRGRAQARAAEHYVGRQPADHQWRSHESSVFVICAVAIFAGGCASTDTVKEAQGQGASRSYQHAYEPVFDAALAAAKTKQLEVIESDKGSRQDSSLAWRHLVELGRTHRSVREGRDAPEDGG